MLRSLTAHRALIRRTPALVLAALTAICTGAQAQLPLAQGSQLPGRTATQQASTGADWVYTVKEGEHLDGLAQELLATPFTGAQLLIHNRLPAHTVFAAGDTLRIPLSWLRQQPEPAKATAVTGNVRIISASDGRQRPLAEDTLIRVGDEILSRTGNATIELADGSTIRINPNSRLIFNKLTQYGKAGMVDTRLRLDHGGISTHVRPLERGGARFEVETPSAVAAVRGTAFSLQSHPGTTDLQVTEGVVAFGPAGKTRNIPAGFSASVDANRPGVVDIYRLPPAPEPNPLPPRLQALPAELSWNSNALHRIDIFEADSGRWIKSDEVHGSHYALNYLDNGRYTINIASLDTRGVAGLPANVMVDVDLTARPATLVAPEEGAGVNDDLPEFQWSYRGSNEVGRVEISETEDFGNLVATSEWAPDDTALPSRPLTPGQYYWRVVTEAGGNSVATTSPRPFVINGTLPPVHILSINYIDSQVRIFWEKTDTAGGYLLQLSEGPEFRNIVKEATVQDTTAALRLIPGRRYFVRLKALSEGPLASRWGPGRELFIE
ncbi:FecR domain-containing protein [Marinobacter zhejiangensis]|nr:FecR domain-containing protein [Marinobacter zhejiangensis]